MFGFASLDRIIDDVTPHLANHGFALTWSGSNDKTMVTVTCRISHEMGHSEEMTLSAEPDRSGNKNGIQAIGSTRTYLERYTARALLGIATADLPDADLNIVNEQNNEPKIDTNQNLKAVSYLAGLGITLAEAEGYVQADVQSWTSEDLETLRKLAKERKQKTVIVDAEIVNEQPNT